jgi:hypothetical protein
MEQMNLEGMNVIPMNYEDPALPAAVRDFRPAIYVDDSGYCCILGPDLERGIVGHGANQQEAIADWLQQFNERIARPAAHDELAKEIIDSMSISKKDVW